MKIENTKKLLCPHCKEKTDIFKITLKEEEENDQLETQFLNLIKIKCKNCENLIKSWALA